MPTKPVVLPRSWANNANWLTGPFIGLPTKIDPGAGIAADGHRAGSNFPTAAEHINYQEFHVADWVRTWLALGTFLPDATAHLVETDTTGRAGLHGLDVIDTVDETAVHIEGVNTLAPTVFAQCTTGATVYQSEVGISDGTGFSANTGAGDATGFLGTMTASPALARAVKVVADAATQGHGIESIHAGLGVAANFSHTGSPVGGVAVNVTATGPSSTTALRGRGSINGAGLLGEGTGGGNANGVEGRLSNNLGFGVYGITTLGATSASRGVKGEARNFGVGVEGSALNGAAILATAPTAGSVAVRFAGKAVDSTYVFNGGLDFNTVTKTFTVSDIDASNQRDLWSSRGGLLIGEVTGFAGTSTNAVVYSAAGPLLTLTGQNSTHRPNTDVTLRFTCAVRTTIATVGMIDLVLEDLTIPGPGPQGGTVIATRAGGGGGGAGDGFSLTVATTAWQATIVWVVPYTIPLAGDRSFQVSFKRNTAVSVAIRDGSLGVYGAISAP